MPHKPGSKAYRDRQRERLTRLGVDGRQAIEQLVADLMRRGHRPREAWRLACELTQEEVAARFNQIRGDPEIRMRGSRICEYEKWPVGGVRPSVRTLRILAAIYKTTWDQLVDIDDLETMPARDRQAFLDSSDLHYGDNRPVIAAESAAGEQVTVPSPRPSSQPSGGGLLAEATHFTGR